MSAAQMITQYVEGPVGKVAVQDRGNKTGASSDAPILLVHGINMSSAVWEPLAVELSKQHRVIAFDLRGHGQSDPGAPYDANAYCQDALTVLDHLAVERVHVVGMSFGGAVATVLAATAPSRIASVTVLGGALTLGEVDFEEAAAQLRQVGARDFFAMLLPQASFAPDCDPSLIAIALAAAADNRLPDTIVAVTETALSSDISAVARSVDVPALVVTGELDLTCPVAHGEAFAEALDTTLVVIAGVGHVLSLEAPIAVWQRIEDHIREIR